jgi:hypothetical protein
MQIHHLCSKDADPVLVQKLKDRDGGSFQKTTSDLLQMDVNELAYCTLDARAGHIDGPRVIRLTMLDYSFEPERSHREYIEFLCTRALKLSRRNWGVVEGTVECTGVMGTRPLSESIECKMQMDIESGNCEQF